jgi:hypothetical protein
MRNAMKWMMGAILVGLAVVPTALAAQLALPAGIVGRTLGALPRPDLDALPGADLTRRLVDLRLDRLDALVRSGRGGVEYDDRRNPAVSGVLILTGADALDVAKAERGGFTVTGRETIEGLDIDLVRLAPPNGQDLGRALRALRKLLPAADISADNLYLPSGGATLPLVAATVATDVRPGTGAGTTIGMIDGGVAAPSSAEAKGFARGAPSPSPHGTAIASLLTGTDRVRGAAPDAALLAADVYGTDPAGGNATAIARALGWFVQRRVPVATISLVGPANALLARAVAGAQARGLMIVAAVGNDGPAAPPAFPASYDGVIAVTGVDGRDRALPEAGRALHLDYAAPGADMVAATLRGQAGKVRGTSYAAPLVAARLARHYTAPDPAARGGAIHALDAEARDLGSRGADKSYGRGLICGDCRTP